MKQPDTTQKNGVTLSEAEVDPAPSVHAVNPDFGFFIKVFKRQLIWSSVAALFVLAIGFPFAFLVPNTFRSSIVAAVDARESVSSDLTRSSDLLSAVTNDFIQRLGSDAFIMALHDYLKAAKFDFNDGQKTIFAVHVSDIMKLLKIKNDETESSLSSDEKGSSNEPKADAPTDADLVRVLKNRMIPTADWRSGTLKLETLGNNPTSAQRLATLTMDFFITTQLTADRDRLKLRSDFLGLELKRAQDYLEELQEARQKAETELTGGAARRDPSGLRYEQADPRAVELKTREAELQDEIDKVEKDYDVVNIERLQTRLKLESEYKTLQSKFQPEHPELIEKRSEMLAFASSSSQTEELSAEVRSLRKQLWDVKAELLSLPQISQKNQLTAAELQQQKLVNSLSDLINQTDLEYGHVLRQLNEPELRSRIRIVSSASFEALPAVNNRRNALAGALALAIAAGVFMLLAREVNNPLARDAWRVFWRTRKPILTQISAASLRKFSRITPARADELRTSLGLVDKDSVVRSRTLLAYRRIELSLRRSCAGKTILFVSAGPQDKLSGFFFSLLNIVSTDTLGRCVLVDCNHLDPVFPVQADKQGLADYLLGNIETAPIVVLRPPSSAFDLIPPVAELSGDKTRVFQSVLLKRFFSRLSDRYDYIFIRGLPETHFIENAALVESVSDCIVCVDSDKTTYAQLDRTLMHLESEKVRGLVMLGT